MALRRIRKPAAPEAPAVPEPVREPDIREIVAGMLNCYRRGDQPGFLAGSAALRAKLAQQPLLVPFRYADSTPEEQPLLHLSLGGARMVEAMAHPEGLRTLDAEGQPVPNPESWPAPEQLFPGAEGWLFTLNTGRERKMLPLTGCGGDQVSYFLGFTGMDTLKASIHLEDPYTHVALLSYAELADLSRRLGCQGVVLDPDTEWHCFLPGG